jgi:hypothetical protein
MIAQFNTLLNKFNTIMNMTLQLPFQNGMEIILVDHILSIINYLPTKGPFTLWPLGRGDLGHFSLKKQDKSPLKYANCGVCKSLEKKFVWLRRVWISIHIVDKLSSIGQTLGVETPKKWCHVSILKTIVYWLLVWRPNKQTFVLH